MVVSRRVLMVVMTMSMLAAVLLLTAWNYRSQPPPGRGFPAILTEAAGATHRITACPRDELHIAAYPGCAPTADPVKWLLLLGAGTAAAVEVSAVAAAHRRGRPLRAQA